MEGFGLWTGSPHSSEAQPVALTGVRIRSRVSALGQRTCVEQVFINREHRPIEALYTFPLPENAAVCGFEAITGERVLTGAIEELAQGLEQYDKAVSEGHGAFMAELWRPDVFSTRVGNLKPGQAVLIRLTYVADVDLADRKLRLSFPTTLAPRYGTATGMDPVEAAMDTDALNPPHVLSVPYGLELAVHIDLGLKLKALASPTHGIRVEAGEGTAWRATLAGGRTEMNRSVVLEAELAKEPGARASIEPGMDASETFAAVTFLPEFETADLDHPAPREIVFLLDCSGSMEGPSIDQAKRALALCLKCLNEGDRFNICRFGSTFELMKPESVPYTQTSLDRALAYVNTIRADLGGTELHAPLQALLTGASPCLLREIILLTDGQVTNEPAIIGMAGAHRGRGRIFSFGIGPACSEFLVKGVARATAGASDFIAANERIEDKVLRMFARLASPHLEDITIDWHGAQADAEPQHPSALFDGEPLRLVARLTGSTPREVTLRAAWQGKQKEWNVPLAMGAATIPVGNAGSFEGAAAGAQTQPMLAATWARARLAALELAANTGPVHEESRQSIVALSKRYHILSKETTLIAIEHRSLDERTRGVPAQRRIPVMLAKGWGGIEGPGQAEACLGGAVCAAPAPAFDPMADMLAEKRAPVTRSRRDAGGAAPRAPKSAPAAGLLKRLFTKTADLAPSREQEQTDPLHVLLLRQSAEGWFGEGDLPAANAAGKPWDVSTLRRDLDALVATLAHPAQERAVATALTVRAFRELFPDREDQWRLAAQKALRWLAKHAPAARAWIGQGIHP